MRLMVVALVVVAVVGCDEPVPENNSCDGDWFSQFLADETPPEADLSCVGDALVDTPLDASCQVTAALAGRTVDHQSKDPVGGMPVSVHHSNDLDAAADWDATSDDNGNVSHDVPLCSPIAYRTERGGDSRVTYGQHVIIEHNAEGGDPTFDFRSVANGTLSLVTLILGVEFDEANGFAFGKVVGCDGTTAVDKVQVLVRDTTCSVPQTFVSGFTENEIPSGFARATTADGFFFVVNVPPGEWTLEGYVKDGDGYRLIAAAPLRMRANEVTLADLQIGRSDGVRLKAGCSGC